jgi:hypothetical protein
VNSSSSASLPMLDAEDSNESVDSANAMNMGFRAYGSSSPGASSSGQAGSGIGQTSLSIWDPSDRIRNAQAALKLMFESVALEPHLYQLLGER